MCMTRALILVLRPLPTPSDQAATLHPSGLCSLQMSELLSMLPFVVVHEFHLPLARGKATTSHTLLKTFPPLRNADPRFNFICMRDLKRFRLNDARPWPAAILWGNISKFKAFDLLPQIRSKQFPRSPCDP